MLTLQLFYDLAGPLIAFNRSGAVYCNLRYYVGWHDRDVQAGNLDGACARCWSADGADALISWYMSLAHELAHSASRSAAVMLTLADLVKEHNSEHEFCPSRAVRVR